MGRKIHESEIPINLITDPLPMEIAGCRIETNFRVMILFEQLMLADEIDEIQRLILALGNFWIDDPDSLDVAINGLLWFYRCGNEQPEEEAEKSGETTTRAYDFDQDADYIYAAFLQQYGIDLQDAKYLHWWKFRALFNGLNEDCRIVKIMQYRLADTSKMDKEQRQFYSEMKKAYKLKRLTKPEKEAQEIATILMNGGDLSALGGGENDVRRQTDI